MGESARVDICENNGKEPKIVKERQVWQQHNTESAVYSIPSVVVVHDNIEIYCSRALKILKSTNYIHVYSTNSEKLTTKILTLFLTK